MNSLCKFLRRSVLCYSLLAIAATWPVKAEAASLRLTWTDNSSNEDGFKIERMTDGSYVDVGTVGANTTSYIDSGLLAGTIYCYRVHAFSSAGISYPSNQACATTESITTAISLGEPNSSSGSSSITTSPDGGQQNPILISQTANNWVDYRATLKIKSTDDGSIGVMFRYVDNKNYYRFSWNTQEKFRRLEKFEKGVRTVLAWDAVPYASGQTYRLEITAQGSLLEVRIDDDPIFSVTDASFDKGTIALYSWRNRGAFFDDILVEDLLTGVVLLWDDFEDDNFTGWTIVDDGGTTDGPSAWSAASGTLVQSSNIGSNTTGKLGTFALYTARSWNDYRVTMKVKSTDDDSVGVMFRYTDKDNYYRFSWDKERVFRRLAKLENGVLTVLADDAVPYKSGQTYQLEIIAQGATLQARIDGAPIFSVTDSSFDKGTIALYSWRNQGAFFDDVLLEDLLTGVVLIWDDFEDDDFTGWTIIDDTGTTNGPSVWSAKSGALVQSSNIGSNTTGGHGTYALY